MRRFWCAVIGCKLRLGNWQQFWGGWFRELTCDRCGDTAYRQISHRKTKPLDVA